MNKYYFYKDGQQVAVIEANTMDDAKAEYMRIFKHSGKSWYRIPKDARPDNIKRFL